MSPEPGVAKSVEIAVPMSDVWRMLTEPEQIVKWLGGARVESQWEIGSDITFTGTIPNFNKTYRDRGTVLALEPEKFLQYGHWSGMSRLPDTPKTVRSLHSLLIG